MVNRSECNICGSKDNLIQFGNGTEWCFTPGCESNNGRGTIVEPIEIPNRGLLKATLAKYGVGQGPDGNLWAPYYVDGKVVAYKVRTPDKKFFFRGAPQTTSLFGTQACSGDRRIIVTEGELDALAAHQMTGYSAVSVRSASSARDDCKKNLAFLESFEKVYVCTDMDQPGRKAAQEILEVLKPGKGLLMTLPEGYKDACGMLADGKASEFKASLFAAKPIGISGVLSDEDVVAKALSLFANESARRGVPTGYSSLDYLLGGLRPGEVTVLVGGTGVGKTAVARQLCVNIANQGNKVFFIPLEMPAEVVLLQLAETTLEGNVLTEPHFSEEDISKTVTQISKKVKFLDHYGTLDPQKLLHTIEYVCRVSDIRFVVLDHLSAVVNGGDDERRATDQAIAGLKGLALQLGLHILVISHISRSGDKEDNDPQLSNIRHSQAVAQYADQVLGIQRTRSSNEAFIKTLKVSRLWGQFGSCTLHWENYHFVEPVIKNKKEVKEDASNVDIFWDGPLGATHVIRDSSQHRGVEGVQLEIDYGATSIINNDVAQKGFNLDFTKGWAYAEEGTSE